MKTMKLNKIFHSLALVTTLALAFAGCATEEKQQAKLQAEATVSRADAEKTALARVPGGTVKEGELEKEKGKLVWHVAYDAGGEYDIARLPDLDGDKKDDIAIIGGSTNQGYTISSIALIGINGGAVKKFGRFEVYNDDSGAVEKNSHTYAWALSADIPSKSPVFSKQKFKQKGKNWTISGKAVKSSPEKDEVEYLVMPLK